MNPNDGTPSSPSRRNTAWPSDAIPSARSLACAGSAPAEASAAAAPSRSAPAPRMNGLPVTPTAVTSPRSTRSAMPSRAVFSDSRPRTPNVFGLVWSWPLSSVINASRPASGPRSTSRTMARVTTSPANAPALGSTPRTFGITSLHPLPQHRAAHAQAHAHRRQPVTDVRALGKLPRELDHQPDARGRQRVAERDRTAPRVHPRVVVGDLEVVEEREHLHGERLVYLDEADVVHGEVVAREQLLGGGYRADAHQLGRDAGEGVVDQPHFRGQAQLGRHLLRRDDAACRAVVDAAGVAGGDPAVRPERGLE